MNKQPPARKPGTGAKAKEMRDGSTSPLAAPEKMMEGAPKTEDSGEKKTSVLISRRVWPD